jgi:hypothetical protein
MQGDQPISEEGQAHLEQQMDQNKQKVDVVKRFVKDISNFLEKVEALEAENRADLMTMFNTKLGEYNKKADSLEKVLSEMSIQKVIEESFQTNSNRELEQEILSEEGNQKSVNSYLIKKIHTLEDRINAKFAEEQKLIREVIKGTEQDKGSLEILLKE